MHSPRYLTNNCAHHRHSPTIRCYEVDLTQVTRRITPAPLVSSWSLRVRWSCHFDALFPLMILKSFCTALLGFLEMLTGCFWFRILQQAIGTTASSNMHTVGLIYSCSCSSLLILCAFMPKLRDTLFQTWKTDCCYIFCTPKGLLYFLLYFLLYSYPNHPYNFYKTRTWSLGIGKRRRGCKFCHGKRFW